MLVFVEGRKPENKEKKTSEKCIIISKQKLFFVLWSNRFNQGWNSFFFFSGAITTRQNPPPSPADTKRSWQTFNDFFSCVASVWTGFTWPSRISWQEEWARSTWPRPWLVLRRYSSSPTRSRRSSSFSVQARIPPVIWWSWLRDQGLVATSWSSLLWDRDKKR